ncbi:dihydroorotate dehydrogenase [Beutenbergia cavernae DSM 12333]|uniref:Dihydroorotate dehydrogenase (quinone) n=1 Tax=Beutenbergia cavernae (strain ATCC BAA-8 / DSM 12333 / CCUG 43141 / JCM 11478 / NBRC 16432 / NCIMB 13614 / HKI 0122) TaxID=471853 RepID=C5C505_BEUC1|nr:dihydroorotate dehydrogenase [Beutenbergia cavernae DSM 12333]
MYGALFSTVALRFDPERAHHVAGTLIRVAGAVPPLRWVLERTFGRPHGQGVELFGRHLRSRFALAAGFDKDATMVAGLAALGFAAVEIGTVTAVAQPGNPRPRLFRVTAQRALLNRMGFNNGGAEAVARRLHRLRSTRHGRALVVGANIGKSKVTAAADAVADYRASARALAPYVDYVVVNVSSPNTPGLRDLQAVDALRPILVAVLAESGRVAHRDVPVLVKIAPDLADDDVRAIARLARELGLEGVVAANTTIRHDVGVGGLSGPPLLTRGLEVVRLARAELGPGGTVIGVGGVSDARDAAAYLDAGADLVQAYTGLIYDGPAWPGRVGRALADATDAGRRQ